GREKESKTDPKPRVNASLDKLHTSKAPDSQDASSTPYSQSLGIPVSSLQQSKIQASKVSAKPAFTCFEVSSSMPKQKGGNRFSANVEDDTENMSGPALKELTTDDEGFQLAREQDIVLVVFEKGKHLCDTTLWHGTEMRMGPRYASLTAGTNADCNIRVHHPSIQGLHFVIVIDKVSRKMSVANTTQNGRLSVSNKVVRPPYTMRIYPGDILKIGDSTMDYKLELKTPEPQKEVPPPKPHVLKDGCVREEIQRIQSSTPSGRNQQVLVGMQQDKVVPHSPKPRLTKHDRGKCIENRLCFGCKRAWGPEHDCAVTTSLEQMGNPDTFPVVTGQAPSSHETSIADMGDQGEAGGIEETHPDDKAVLVPIRNSEGQPLSKLDPCTTTVQGGARYRDTLVVQEKTSKSVLIESGPNPCIMMKTNEDDLMKRGETILTPTPLSTWAVPISFQFNVCLEPLKVEHGKAALNNLKLAQVRVRTIKVSIQSFEKPPHEHTLFPTHLDDTEWVPWAEFDIVSSPFNSKKKQAALRVNPLPLLLNLASKVEQDSSSLLFLLSMKQLSKEAKRQVSKTLMPT
ncbi:hypothetical protein EJ110_NYTH52026, partial [Nymphaea thermarum]